MYRTFPTCWRAALHSECNSVTHLRLCFAFCEGLDFPDVKRGATPSTAKVNLTPAWREFQHRVSADFRSLWMFENPWEGVASEPGSGCELCSGGDGVCALKGCQRGGRGRLAAVVVVVVFCVCVFVCVCCGSLLSSLRSRGNACVGKSLCSW